MSQRQLAREIAGTDDQRRIENERRQIGKYLAGQHAPSPEKARRIAGILGKPAEFFIDEVAAAKRLPELMGEVYELVADISDLIEERLGGELPKAPPWAATLHDHLRGLEGAVDRMADATTQSLARLEGAIAELSDRIEPPDAQGREAAR